MVIRSDPGDRGAEQRSSSQIEQDARDKLADARWLRRHPRRSSHSTSAGPASSTIWNGRPSRSPIRVRSDSCRATRRSSARRSASRSRAPRSEGARAHVVDAALRVHALHEPESLLHQRKRCVGTFGRTSDRAVVRGRSVDRNGDEGAFARQLVAESLRKGARVVTQVAPEVDPLPGIGERRIDARALREFGSPIDSDVDRRPSVMRSPS